MNLVDVIPQRVPEGCRIGIVQGAVVDRLRGVALFSVPHLNMCVRAAGTADSSPGLCRNLLSFADILSFADSGRSGVQIDDGFIVGAAVDRDCGESFGSGGSFRDPNYDAVGQRIDGGSGRTKKGRNKDM